MIRQTRQGHWVVDGDTHFTKWVSAANRLDHDQGVLSIIAPHIKQGTTVFDIGANIGTHTVAYAKAVGPAGVVIAIEPNPTAAACLVLNCANLPVIPVICGADQHQNVYNFAKLPNVGASHITTESNFSDTIRTISVDSLHKLVVGNKVSFIKIDVEGFEVKVLSGAKLTIHNNRPAMYIEVNVGALDRAGTSEKELLDLITEYGYTIEPIPKANGIQYDVLCLPKEL